MEDNKKYSIVLKRFDMEIETFQIQHSRFVLIGVASFASHPTCTTSPGGFARLTYGVLEWIRKVKVHEQSLYEVSLTLKRYFSLL